VQGGRGLAGEDGSYQTTIRFGGPRPLMSSSPVTPVSVEQQVLTRPGLLELLERVPDPRARRGVRHRLAVILAVGLAAVVAGATSFAAIGEWVVDADARKADLEVQNEGAGVLFKMKHDPRVTPVGRIMRRYSIDELPQLLNVVRGDMSLVGPRPPLGEEVARYEDAAHRRLRVKPGLTGLWQVSGRSDLTWDEAMRLDLRYVDNWSVAMDALILWKTARAVFGAAGAY